MSSDRRFPMPDGLTPRQQEIIRAYERFRNVTKTALYVGHKSGPRFVRRVLRIYELKLRRQLAQ